MVDRLGKSILFRHPSSFIYILRIYFGNLKPVFKKKFKRKNYGNIFLEKYQLYRCMDPHENMPISCLVAPVAY